jgi:hypothetical protein
MSDTDASAIQHRMDAILGELSGGGFVLRPGNFEAACARRAALEAEYAALARSLPPSGCRAGVLEVNMRLGTSFAKPPQRAVGEMDEEIRADPMLRHLHETGQDWD